MDRCPDVVGDAANGGCPWTDSDGDGVPDKDDNCPNEVGTASNNGCPDEPTDLVSFINGENSRILFGASSSKLDSSDMEKIDKLKSLLDQYPSSSISIEGTHQVMVVRLITRNFLKEERMQ